ncbi:hypothetical protein [Lactobacillus xylocopicola]|uniref:Uncharacterized protein n=1 Tax=Lactobacillus xylocopicola TaxID=2976676 RepID=A0ABM8BIA5_9LACO|nr:hypothetical protein [Lactobacillus xylocopicola]BDR61029.1 hypothetical protein KIM322_12900 [Lactobacillus xylocopicola]
MIFWVAVDVTTAPKIGGEEKDRASSDNVYEPAWVDLSSLRKINLMPPKFVSKIIAALK